MKKTLAVLMIGLVPTFGCETKERSEAKPGGNPESINKEPTPKSPEQGVTLHHKGEAKAFKSFFVTEEVIAGSVVPQLTFFEAEVGCEARTDLEIPRFYAAFASEPGIPVGEHDSPNWGYTGIPGFVPGSPDEADPRDSWGKVNVTASEEKSISGSLRYESNDVLIYGEFTATKCPPSL